jgi:hypothetical protein
MFSSPSTNAPTQYRTNNTFATTFTGPVQRDQRMQDVTRNQSMAQGAMQGNTRQFNQQAGAGVRAGGKMQNYLAQMKGDSAAAKGFAQGQQDMMDKMADNSTANLQFQERLSGERGWVRDLLLDRDESLNKERMGAYKRFVDTNLGEYERQIKEAVAAQARQTEILGGLL